MNQTLNPPNKPLSAATEIRRSITRMARLFAAGMERGELTPARLAALGILHRGGPTSASALALRLGVRPQSMTRILSDLETNGLVERERDTEDMRGSIIKLTLKARHLLRSEGARRDRALSETMQRMLSAREIAELLAAAEILNKLADGWGP